MNSKLETETGTWNRYPSYKRALVHVDGDAFFTSVEQAVDPSLKGRPVVSGKERGIIACASYEAKALGIKRGIQLHVAQKMCPGLIVLPSDYETYSLFSKRMFNIMRHFTPMVEENSIDEGFADITGVRRVFHASYPEIALQMKNTIQKELDITVSVGLSLSKGLTKLASKFKKPDGFTAVPARAISAFLQKNPLEEVWGFGHNLTQLLQKHGLRTAYDFISRPEGWVKNLLGKTGVEIWHELRGETVYAINTEEKSTYASISKCKTFTSPSSDRNFVYAKLMRNLESAFIKLRRYSLRTPMISVVLRRKDFSQIGLEAKLNRATSATQEVVPLIKEMFDKLFEPGVEYRTTMICLWNLEEDRMEQGDLFMDRVRIEKMEQVSHVIDEVNERFGKHALSLGTSLYLSHHKKTARDELAPRKKNLLPGETARQRVRLPQWSIRV